MFTSATNIYGFTLFSDLLSKVRTKRGMNLYRQKLYKLSIQKTLLHKTKLK